VAALSPDHEAAMATQQTKLLARSLLAPAVDIAVHLDDRPVGDDDLFLDASL